MIGHTYGYLSGSKVNLTTQAGGGLNDQAQRPGPASRRQSLTKRRQHAYGLPHLFDAGRYQGNWPVARPLFGKKQLAHRRRGARIGTERVDRKSTRLNSSHMSISYAVFCLKKKK